MELLIFLIFGHFVADYALQTEYMALGKNKWNPLPGTPWIWPMLAHCSIHGFVTGAIFMALGVSGALYIAIIECILHFIIDCIKCKKVIGYDTDQILHIICKILYTL